MQRNFLLSALLIIGLSPAWASEPTAEVQRLSDDVKMLASDALQGRGPGSEGERRTVEYLIEQLSQLPVQPGGDAIQGKRQWTQAVPMVRNRIIGTPTLSATLNGKKTTYQQGQEMVVRASQAGATEVAVNDAPVVFIGYGVSAPDRQWDDYKGVDLRGKIGLVLVNDPDFETGDGDFGGKAMTWYGRWTYKYEEGARQGALGILIVHETEPAAYGWPTVKNSNTNDMFDIVRDHPETAHPAVAGWVQRDLAETWMKAAGLDFSELKKQAQSRDFHPVELKDVHFSASYKVEREVVESSNVLARIEGKKYPEETVIYSAHWDHLGVGLPDATGDTIYNGAIDNATGVAAVLALARRFSQEQPERSVVFFFPTGEEKNLLGSTHYASHPLYPLEKTVAVLNVDAMDPGDVASPFTTPGEVNSSLHTRLIDTGKEMGMAYVADPNPNAGYFFRSDHFPFAKQGVPALWFGSGLLTGAEGEGVKVGKDYVAHRYHQPGDEWQADWRFKGMVQQVDLLYRVGAELANSRDWPEWSAGAEFRAVREQSSASRK